MIGLGDASMGLCGGFSLTVRDLFETGVPPPPETEPPANGSPRFKALVRRQVESFDWFRVPVRFYLVSAFDRWRSSSFEREWPRIKAEIDAGHPPALGLLRKLTRNPMQLVGNHQVLGYAYDERPDRVEIRLYEPNWPDRDDVSVEVDRDPATGRATAMRQSTGEPLYAVFLASYRRRPVTVWR
jgi:hypothetical protein